MAHDFKRFPELTNRQMQMYLFDSPHEQITEDFFARVIKVSDGDTIRVETDFRDFDFPIRISNMAAPELNEQGGLESQEWLSNEILGKEVRVILSKERVEKWGRLLADIIVIGDRISEASVRNGHAVPWDERTEGTFDFEKELEAFII